MSNLVTALLTHLETRSSFVISEAISSWLVEFKVALAFLLSSLVGLSVWSQILGRSQDPRFDTSQTCKPQFAKKNPCVCVP